MRKYLLIMVALVLVAVAAIGVMPADKGDVAQAVTSDGTEITMRISAWQITGDDCAFRVKFSYSGGHGSNGYMYACVPWLEPVEDQSNHATALQYRSTAIDEMITLIEQREADQNMRDTRDDIWGYVSGWTGRAGQVTLR